MKTAAIYARVSSEKQKEEQTISSQTAALVEFAQSEGYTVPSERIFQDEGYSGSVLVRPALECLRDLAAEGQIEAVLIYSPDRLSRKYAYQVLLMEEFSRQGVEVIFIKSPHSATPEDQLLLQFQGMIAEYERVQITERTRRGKRHRAKSGLINVLCGAPYGYRYVRKSETANAFYEVIEEEAAVFREVYRLYTEDAVSIGAITRQLNHQAFARELRDALRDSGLGARKKEKPKRVSRNKKRVPDLNAMALKSWAPRRFRSINCAGIFAGTLCSRSRLCAHRVWRLVHTRCVQRGSG